MSTTSAGGSARLAIATAWLALALGLAGCVSQETRRDAINDINAAFKVEYESILKENGTHRVGSNPVATHEAMIAALQQLGMVVTQQSRDLGFIAVEAPAPSPLTRAEWDRAAAADLPKAREILRRHIGSLADLFHFEPEGVDTVITATIIEERGGVQISLTMRMREVAPPTQGLPRRDYPPPTALRLGLDKIWARLDSELKVLATKP
jgi:hypothetical protein